ncbi:MAG TPA: acetyl-CoA carboxylase biotin carboxylase subunit, partial [Dehalococcoidia bacterium]|nr:acetyl-CoA carboxylase biotin carboxylase subunit [Dehalococcoidia bacterium]
VKAVGYTNLGTLEFLLDSEGNINFLEMNTRLQVEHPVTELITSTDLVADQIRVAAGEELAYRQEDIRINGWAIECRIAAEDPFNNFLPSVGHVRFVSVPGGPGVRMDSALYDGLEISIYYDPMIAKLCTWGRDRTEAIGRMGRALREFKIVGVHTNIPFHLQVLENPYFLAGTVDTSFVEKHFHPGTKSGLGEERVALLGAALLAHSKGHKRSIQPEVTAKADGSNWKRQGRLQALSNRDYSRRGRWRRST